MQTQKLALENKIFAYADRRGYALFARQGMLFCPQADGYLQALITVYNRFFKRQNQRFLSGQPAENWPRLFAAQAVYPPSLNRPPGVPFYAGDLAAEITLLSYF